MKTIDIGSTGPVRALKAFSLKALFAPVDSASLAYFRIAYGAIMLWEVWRMIDHHWVEIYFSGNDFYFTFWPFDFVHPWPGIWMDIHLYLMGVVAFCIILGFFYRVAAILFFLMVTYLFLLEEARYLNHMYLVCLVSFLMIFVPAHRRFSLDAAIRPEIASRTVPSWSVWLLRFQVAVPYFFGGIAKLNHDWLHGEPLRAWLTARTDFPGLGQFFENEAMVWLMNYGSLLLDLSVAFLLLNRRTRVIGYIGILTFHFMNSRLFGIGIFPWFMIAATLIFFRPDWPSRLLHDLRYGHVYRAPLTIGGAVLGFCIGGFLPDSFSLVQATVGAVGVAVAAYHLDEPFVAPQPAEASRQLNRPPRSRRRRNRRQEAPLEQAAPAEQFSWGLRSWQTWAVGLLGVWVAIQVLVPLRHLVIPGNVHWTEEGHNFSWHMKLRDKDSTGLFLVTDAATGEEWEVDPWDYLTSTQTSKMLARPHMIIEFVRYLEGEMKSEGYEDVEVRALVFASLNGRLPQMLIDPEVDLTQVAHPWFGHADWILPLVTPLDSADQVGLSGEGGFSADD